jgi:hypothetical protein
MLDWYEFFIHIWNWERYIQTGVVELGGKVLVEVSIGSILVVSMVGGAAVTVVGGGMTVTVVGGGGGSVGVGNPLEAWRRFTVIHTSTFRVDKWFLRGQAHTRAYARTCEYSL